MDKKIIDLLKASPLCKGMDAEKLSLLFAQGIFALRRFPAGALIFQEGETPQSLYLLVSGRVEICRDTLSGRRILLTDITRPGDVFGEIYLFIAQGSYDMYAWSAQDTQVVAISRDFLSLKENDLSAIIQGNLLSIFAQKAYGMKRRLDILGGGSLKEKLARFFASRQRPGKALQLDMTREALADYLGVTRPSLSRELGQLQKAGIIAVDGRRIEILDQEALEGLL
ncbi:MAG: Crp/Fnr family transcriptional regulator [Eubacterium sp.]|nr:Crp/Fnr family transcriptional regulator [Eubacterium sp.]